MDDQKTLAGKSLLDLVREIHRALVVPGRPGPTETGQQDPRSTVGDQLVDLVTSLEKLTPRIEKAADTFEEAELYVDALDVARTLVGDGQTVRDMLGQINERLKKLGV